MKSILEDIKNNEFKHVYLFYGEEGYLKKQYRDKLSSAWLPEDDTMNRTVFRGKGVSPGEVIDLGETLPFLAQNRVIILEETGFLRDSAKNCRSIFHSCRTICISCLWRRRLIKEAVCIRR